MKSLNDLSDRLAEWALKTIIYYITGRYIFESFICVSNIHFAVETRCDVWALCGNDIVATQICIFLWFTSASPCGIFRSKPICFACWPRHRVIWKCYQQRYISALLLSHQQIFIMFWGNFVFLMNMYILFWILCHSQHAAFSTSAKLLNTELNLCLTITPSFWSTWIITLFCTNVMSTLRFSLALEELYFT